MIYSSSNYKGLILLSAFAGVFAIGSSVSDAANVEVMIYYNPGAGVIMYPSHTITMTNAHYAEIGGTNMEDDQQTRWHYLLSQRYTYGQGTKLVRGWDIVEDFDINWSTPALANAGHSRWVPFEVNGTSSDWVWTKTGNVGPHPNEFFLGNPNMLAAIDDHALFWDDDGTFSVYSMGGGLQANYTWTTLTGGGSLNNRVLDEALLKQHFIGAEESQLAFLNGDNAIDFYRITDGVFLRTDDYSVVNTGPLQGDVTLADIIDGKVDGYMFIGIDGVNPGAVIISVPAVPVPEPSTIILVSLVAGMFPLLRRYRRR